MHFITTSKDPDGSYPCSSLRSALSRGLHVTVIGLPETRNLTRAHQDPSMFHKDPYMIMEHFEKFGQTYQDDDIIVFNKRDVLYATNDSQLEVAYLRMEKMNTILFAAERDCWPSDGIGCRKPPNDVMSSYKYLHCGGWVARYKIARQFMHLFVQALASIQLSSGRYEQSALHRYTLGTAGKIEINLEIDHNCTIFQTSSKSLLAEKTWWLFPDRKDGPYMQPDGVIMNLETNSYPLLYHFNAGNDEVILDIESLLWTKTKLLNPNYKMQCESYLKEYSKLSSCQERGTVKKNVPFYCDAIVIADIESQKYAKSVNEISKRQNKSKLDFHNKKNHVNLNYLFPAQIPIFEIRKDPYTKKAVERGRTKLLEDNKKYSMLEYKKILQCSKNQPELYGKGGALSLAKKIPLTRETIMLVAAHIESNCILYNECRDIVKKYLNGEYTLSHIHLKLGGFENSKLFRIINGTYYYDWPWGRHRIDGTKDEENGRLVIKHVLNYVSDMKDSVFFYGAERGTLPPGIPVPHFSSSPEGSKSSDIPGLWLAAYRYEIKRYESEKYMPLWKDNEISLQRNDTENGRNTSSKSLNFYYLNLNPTNMTELVIALVIDMRIDIDDNYYYSSSYYYYDYYY